MNHNSIKYINAMGSLFTTCNLKCGYCTLAESGSVLDFNQLNHFKDINIIDQILSFFMKYTSNNIKWHLMLTGGEPLLMPHFEYFCQKMGAMGNKISLYTNLSLKRTHTNMKYLFENENRYFDFIMASYHPEAESEESLYIQNLLDLKNKGYKVILRFVGHPLRLRKTVELNELCKKNNIGFFSTNLVSENYPKKYKNEEKRILKKTFSTKTQVVMMQGGVYTDNTMCRAGVDYCSIEMISGKISRCIFDNVSEIGNLYEGKLNLLTKEVLCPVKGIDCSCDAHLSYELPLRVDGFYHDFEKLKEGYVDPIDLDEQNKLIEDLKLKGLHFSELAKMSGQVKDESKLVFTATEIKKNPPRLSVTDLENQVSALEKVCEERLNEIIQLKSICDEREKLIFELNKELGRNKE